MCSNPRHVISHVPSGGFATVISCFVETGRLCASMRYIISRPTGRRRMTLVHVLLRHKHTDPCVQRSGGFTTYYFQLDASARVARGGIISPIAYTIPTPQSGRVRYRSALYSTASYYRYGVDIPSSRQYRTTSRLRILARVGVKRVSMTSLLMGLAMERRERSKRRAHRRPVHGGVKSCDSAGWKTIGSQGPSRVSCHSA